MSERDIIVIQRAILIALICSFIFPLMTSLFGIPIYPFDVLLLPLGVVWIGDFIYYRRIYPLSSTDISLHLLAFWIFFTSIVAFDKYLSVIGGLIWLRAAILFSIVRTTYGRVYFKKDIYLTAMALVLFQSILIITQGILQVDIGALNQYFGTQTPLLSYQMIYEYKIYRAQGTLGNPNTVANWLVLLIPIVLVGISDLDDNLTKQIHVLAVILGANAVLFTISLGSTAVLLGYIVLGSVIYLQPSRYISITLGALGGSVLTYSVAFSPLLSIVTTSKSVQKRLEMIQLAIDIFVRRPLFGTGYNNFIIGIESLFGDPGIYIRGATTSVHNIPILFAVETGIIGAILFIGFLLVVARCFVRGYLNSDGRCSIATGYLISYSGLLGTMLLYTTFISFQFLPLSIVVIASGIAICETKGM